MSSVYQLKPAFQRQLRPLVRLMASSGVTANSVTIIAAALSVAVGGCIAVWPEATWPLLLLPGFLFVRMALNAIDGMLAREHDQRSRRGAILNELGDVVSDSALYAPLALVPALNPRLMVLVVVLAVISEFVGVLGPQIGAGRRYDGPMGKSDRAVVFGVFGLWLGMGLPAGWWLQVALALIALLLTATVVNRARGALGEAGV